MLQFPHKMLNSLSMAYVTDKYKRHLRAFECDLIPKTIKKKNVSKFYKSVQQQSLNLETELINIQL
jgi:hypothetical protein